MQVSGDYVAILVIPKSLPRSGASLACSDSLNCGEISCCAAAGARTPLPLVGMGLVRNLKFVIGERKDHELHPGSQIRVQGEHALIPEPPRPR
jgi:hypothetical protein